MVTATEAPSRYRDLLFPETALPERSRWRAWTAAGRGCCRAAADLLYPPHCLACGVPLDEHGNGALCPACVGLCRWIGADRCRRCGMPAGAALGAVPHCAACERQPLTHVAGSCAVGRYEGPLRRLILSLKFGHGLAAAPLLGRLLARRVKQTLLDEERVGPLAVVAVPLARDVRRARGFNQSEELAGFLAAELGWTTSFRLLRKVRSTPPQALQTLEGRRVNLEGAFAVTARRVSSLARQGVLLVDDVVTTGTTAWTCAEALRAAGTGPVWVAAVARTC